MVVAQILPIIFAALVSDNPYAFEPGGLPPYETRTIYVHGFGKATGDNPDLVSCQDNHPA